MAKKPEIADGSVVEENDTLLFKCNRPLSFTEYVNLVAKVQMEEERIGRRIIIVPQATEVVKT
jgi:hypothetical protein